MFACFGICLTFSRIWDFIKNCFLIKKRVFFNFHLYFPTSFGKNCQLITRAVIMSHNDFPGGVLVLQHTTSTSSMPLLCIFFDNFKSTHFESLFNAFPVVHSIKKLGCNSYVSFLFWAGFSSFPIHRLFASCSPQCPSPKRKQIKHQWTWFLEVFWSPLKWKSAH